MPYLDAEPRHGVPDGGHDGYGSRKRSEVAEVEGRGPVAYAGLRVVRPHLNVLTLPVLPNFNLHQAIARKDLLSHGAARPVTDGSLEHSVA